MKKLINFAGLADSIQQYANRNHNGNFTKAVMALCCDGIKKEGGSVQSLTEKSKA